MDATEIKALKLSLRCMLFILISFFRTEELSIVLNWHTDIQKLTVLDFWLTLKHTGPPTDFYLKKNKITL